jgi:hypothetical protein
MADVPGATSATYTPPPGTLNDNHALFRCTVSNAAGSVTSASEMLFVTSAATPPTGFTSPITACGQVGVLFSYTINSSGGTAPVTFSAGPLPGGLSLNPNTGLISGTPTTPGITDILLGASNSAGSLSTTLALTLAATPPAISWDSWRLTHLGASTFNPDVAGDQADPDGDGIKNLFEYALGTDPLDAGTWPWNCAVQNGYFTLTVPKNPQATNVTWAAESSSDLTVWDEADTTVLQNDINTFQVRDNFPVPTKSRRFLRVKLSVP